MGSQIDRYLDWKIPVLRLGQILIGAVSLGAVAMAQSGPLVLEREGRVISLEPYAPNIVRVTMSTDKATASGLPGYGFVAQPSAEGWTHERDCGRRRRIPLGPDGCARVAREPSQGETTAADAARCVESPVARSLLRRRGRAWTSQ